MFLYKEKDLKYSSPICLAKFSISFNRFSGISVYKSYMISPVSAFSILSKSYLIILNGDGITPDPYPLC